MTTILPESFEQFNQRVLTGYRKQDVLDRFENAVQLSDGYSGLLQKTRDTAVDLGPRSSGSSFAELGDIDASQAHELKMLAIRIKNAGLARVAIEAAHGYMHDDLEDDVFLSSVRSQARQAGMLSALLDEEGIDTTHIVFVDDYNPDPSDGRHKQVLVVDDLIKEVTENGFEPELLMFESNMVSLAKEMMRIMDEDQSLVIRSDSGTGSLQDLVLSRRNIELYRGRDGMVSCAMLDAAFSLVKLTTIANGVVNILPRAPEGQGFSYSGQQRKMRTILSEHLGLRVPPVFNLFVNTDGAKNVIASGAHHILRKPRS